MTDLNSQVQSAPQQLYSLAQAAAYLGCHRSSVYRKVISGELRVLRGSGITRISLSELRRYLNNSELYHPKKRNRHLVR
jgi:excisionase family DNA binding protein